MITTVSFPKIDDMHIRFWYLSEVSIGYQRTHTLGGKSDII